MLVTACGSGGADTDRTDAAQTQSQCAGLAKPEMVWIAGGTFLLGDEAALPEEGPAREVTVDGFWISNTEVTNAQFAQFVAETGYKTEAELPPPALPNSPPEMQQPGSAVFHRPSVDNSNWWRWKVGANWRRPTGADSDIKGRDNDPVVHVTYNDARAYAEWAGGTLPSEEQWEYAARAAQATMPEPVTPDGSATANYYQGVFPFQDSGDDGFLSRAPVGCFAPNAYGL